MLKRWAQFRQRQRAALRQSNRLRPFTDRDEPPSPDLIAEVLGHGPGERPPSGGPAARDRAEAPAGAHRPDPAVPESPAHIASARPAAR